jgi:hypothetical protein
MLVRCNQNCKHSVTTDASLDIEADEAVCNYCGEVLENITSYAKNAMKMNGDVIRRAKGKAFNFRCSTCNKDMQAISEDGIIVGVGCSRAGECDFNISAYMERAIELYSSIDEPDE